MEGLAILVILAVVIAYPAIRLAAFWRVIRTDKHR